MAKMKFDAQKAKQFAVEKAEILGIAVCSLLTTLFLVICILSIFGASSEDRKIAENAKALKQAIDSAEPPAEGEPVKKEGTETNRGGKSDADLTSWPAVASTAFLTRTPMFDAAAAGDPKRRNPTILPVDVADRSGKEKYLQVDFVQAGVKVYEFNTFRGTMGVAERVDDKTRSPVSGLRTERMVVVTATFPYKDQIAQYIKALRIEGDTEAKKEVTLFNDGLAPKLAGLNVYRRSYDPITKKASDWEPVYTVEKDGKILVSKAVQRLLKEAVYDEVNIAQYGNSFFPTAVTPLPALGDRTWPPLKLDEKAAVVAREDNTPATPGSEKPKSVFGPSGLGKPPKGGEMPKEEGPAVTRKEMPAAKVGLIYADRLQGKINPFNPYGLYPPTAEQPKDIGTGAPNTEFTPLIPSDDEMKKFFSPRNKAPDKTTDPNPVKSTEEHPYKALMEHVGGVTASGKTVVRFFDAGLQPGQQYQYSIQVRMVNPNFGKAKEVAFPGLALPKELLSPPVYTEPVRVPTTSHFYVIDQFPLETSTSLKKNSIDRDPKNLPPHKAAVQIHQWVEEAGRGEQKICDWAIAERLLVERGDTIGRKAVEVEIPTWDELRSAFFLGVASKVPYKAPGGKFDFKIVRKAAVPIDFGQEERGPLVVDFEGGKTQYKVPAGTLFDDGSMEMLVLMPDGTMVLRESRADSDEEEPTGGERARVYNAWAERLRHYRQAGQPTESKTP